MMSKVVDDFINRLATLPISLRMEKSLDEAVRGLNQQDLQASMGPG